MAMTLDERLAEICSEFEPNKVQEKKNKLYSKVCFCKGAVTDLLHKLELGKLDAIGRTLAVNELIKMLRERRRCKNEYEAYKSLKRNEVYNRANSVRMVISNKKKRKYSPRALKDMVI